MFKYFQHATREERLSLHIIKFLALVLGTSSSLVLHFYSFYSPARDDAIRILICPFRSIRWISKTITAQIRDNTTCYRRDVTPPSKFIWTAHQSLSPLKVVVRCCIIPLVFRLTSALWLRILSAASLRDKFKHAFEKVSHTTAVISL